MAGLGPAIHALNSWMPGTSPGMTALGRFNLAHSSEGGRPPANPNFGFSRKRLRNCAAPFLNSPVVRTNRVHDRLPPYARTSTVALADRGSAAVILLFPAVILLFRRR
jgi:hypothetical protein